MPDSKSPPPTESDVRLVAGLSGADVRTARRFLKGEPVKGLALRERLDKALAEAKSRASKPAFTLDHAVCEGSEEPRPKWAGKVPK